MGLFGPDWSWDEIQKKDAIIGEIKKENDRVLAKQKEMLDNQKSSNYTSYNVYYTPDPKHNNRVEKVYMAKVDSNIAKGNIIVAILHIIDKHLPWDYFYRILIIIAIGIGIYVFPIFTLNIILIYFGIIVLIFIYNIIKTYRISNQIRKTDCYKGILEEIKKEELNDINYIGICKSMVKVIKGVKSSSITLAKSETIPGKEYKYADYKFPNLEFVKQSILLGMLLKELEIKNKYTIKVVTDFYSSCDTRIIPKSEQSYDGLDQCVFIYAINKENAKSLKNNEKLNQKNNKKKKKDDLKQGKTW